MPKVTIMTPVYNGEKFLREMMDSILAQTMQDFEWVIINDGSTDSTEQIIKSYTDSRIRYCANDGNQGIAYSFNRAIELSTGDFLAIAEADDINHPRRLELQTAYMQENEDIGLVCSKLKEFTGKQLPFAKISKANKITKSAKYNKHGMIFNETGLRHASTMYRKSILTNCNIYYNSNYEIACDHFMFITLSRVTGMVRLTNCLLHYRIHENNTSKNQQTTSREANNIYRKFFQKEFGFSFKGEFVLESKLMNKIKFKKLIDLTEMILMKVSQHSDYDTKLLKLHASGLAYKYIKGFNKSGLSHHETFYLYKSTPILHSINMNRKIKLRIKCLAHQLGIKGK